MARQTWLLQDTNTGTFCEHFDFREELPLPDGRGTIPVHIVKRRLYGGLSDGVDLLEIDNGRLAFTVLLTRGMGLWRGSCRRENAEGVPQSSVELKWNAPVRGPVHPKYVPLAEPSGLGWLDGFDEWLVRCGLESNGAAEHDEKGTLRYGLHGRIANTPADCVALTVDTETGEITLGGIMSETRMFFKKLELMTVYTTYAGSTRLSLRDVVTNRARVPGEFQLLYHINTGMPLAAPGSRIAVPYEKLRPKNAVAVEDLPQWSRCGPETPGSEEVVYFIDPAGDADGRSTAILADDSGESGIAISFDKNRLPCFSLWKSRLPDGDGYVVGLEPATNFPNTHSAEKAAGRVVSLDPAQTFTSEIDVDVLTSPEAVEQAVERAADIQKNATGKIEEKPYFT